MSVRQEFLDTFGEIVDVLEAELGAQGLALPPEAIARVRLCAEYNVPHGKLNRGLAVVECYRAFRGARSVQELDARERQDAYWLGWCVEWLQAFFLVADDIMDGSKTRRGRTCYYLLDKIGLDAVNDALLLEAHIYRLLRQRFRGRADDAELHADLVDIFQEVTFHTELGQMLDLTCQAGGQVDLSRFTEETLHRIYRFKTCMYSFYLPVALGMRLAGERDPQRYRQAEAILVEMGKFFQAQDDYLDCFGDPTVTGKIGTDIEENKCTWPVVEALKRMSDEQRAVLAANYARRDADCVERVKQLYREVGIPEAFPAYETQSYQALQQQIEQLRPEMPVGAFEFLLNKIYKRSK